MWLSCTGMWDELGNGGMCTPHVDTIPLKQTTNKSILGMEICCNL
jgi:hypothetical protein